MEDYLSSVKKQFEYYKSLGDKTFSQLSEEAMFWQYNDDSNSVAIMVKHLVGNMLSRWTDFMTTDGEKEWRKRDKEFISTYSSKFEIILDWNKGWDCLFTAINPLQNSDLNKQIYIRNMGHSVTEAINRQLAHYSYHVGQIVYLGKMIQSNKWDGLSIAKGGSKAYNSDKFSKPKRKEHFTNDL